MILRLIPVLAALVFPCACQNLKNQSSSLTSFADEAAFLEQHAGGIVMESGTGAFVVCPPLEGRVMTSTVERGGGSIGFVNRDMILNPPESAQFYNYGGEDRFWLGPEGGPFSIYFAAGQEFSRDLWQVPDALQSGAFAVDAVFSDSVRLMHEMEVRNRLGTTFQVGLKRTIEKVQADQVGRILGGEIPAGAQWVAFQSRNEVENTGEQTWDSDTGLLCAWILGMFQAGPQTWVIAPFRTAANTGDWGPPVQTEYFGTLDDSRLKQGSDFVLFKTDAQYQSKIGLFRHRAQTVMGSYDPLSGIFTLVEFGPMDRSQPYLVELWDTEHPAPYNGDVSNSYNHSGPEPFYEIESSSPALSLAPGQSHEHRHTTIHLKLANPEELAAVVERALGVSWQEVLQLGVF